MPEGRDPQPLNVKHRMAGEFRGLPSVDLRAFCRCLQLTRAKKDSGGRCAGSSGPSRAPATVSNRLSIVQGARLHAKSVDPALRSSA